MIKNIVIIGFGNIAIKHYEVFKSLGINVVASSNRSETNRSTAKNLGINNTFENYHEMIQTCKPDGILVCVPFWNMYEVLKDIIPYQIPILAEKPTGTSLSEHIDLCTLSEKYRTPIMVGFNRRHYSNLEKCITTIGGVQNITNVLIEWSEDPNHLKLNRHLNDSQISKQVFGNTIHGLDLLTFLAGEVKNPNITRKKVTDKFGIIMNLNGISENGVLYNFNSSWDNFVPWRLVIYSTNNRFVFAPLESCERSEGKVKSTIELEKRDIDFKAGFYLQAQKFISEDFSNNDIQSATNSMQLAELLTVE